MSLVAVIFFSCLSICGFIGCRLPCVVRMFLPVIWSCSGQMSRSYFLGLSRGLSMWMWWQLCFLL